MQINGIEAAVHLGYHRSLCKQNFHLRRLNQAWDERVAQLAQEPNSLLVYVSCIPLTQGELTISPLQTITAQLKEDEQRRREEYKALLGNRFLLIKPEPANQVLDGLPGLIRELDSYPNPRGVQLLAYGEYEELCVKDCFEQLKRHFPIPTEQKPRVLSALCLSQNQLI